MGRKSVVNLGQFVHAVLRQWWLVILLSILGGLAGYLIVSFSPTVYGAVVTLYSMDLGKIQEAGAELDYYDVELSRVISSQFSSVILSNRVTTPVTEQLSEYNLSEEDIVSMIAIDNNVEKNVFYIKAESTDPTIASRVVNAVAAQYTIVISELLNADYVGILEQAKIPEEPIPKNLVAIALVGAIAGFALGFTGVYLTEYFNPKVYRKEDLMDNYDMGVLGSVPEYAAVEGRESYDVEKA